MSDSKYLINDEFLSVNINVHPKANEGKTLFVTHTLRKPTFKEEEERERMSSIVTKTGAIVDGQQSVIQDADYKKANVALYDKLALKISYKHKGEEVTKEVASVENGKKVLDEIKSDHKNTAVLGLFTSEFDVETPEDFEFSLGDTEWTVAQKIGGGVLREDGSLSDPDFVIRYTLSDPTEADRDKYESAAVSNSHYDRMAKMQVERSYTQLKPLCELFDKLIKNIDGAVIKTSDGKSVDIDAKNPEHLKEIPASFKKVVVIKAFRAGEASLGN